MLACVIAPNTRMTRVSSWPERSMASMVFSKVGGAAWLAMESTSARCARIPASRAG